MHLVCGSNWNGVVSANSSATGKALAGEMKDLLLYETHGSNPQGLGLGAGVGCAGAEQTSVESIQRGLESKLQWNPSIKLVDTCEDDVALRWCPEGNEAIEVWEYPP